MMHTLSTRTTILGIAALMATAAACAGARPVQANDAPQARAAGKPAPAAAAEDIDILSGRWPAISYSGFRAGQSPDNGTYPSQQQVAEDLRILQRNWRLIRLYGSDRHSEDVLAVIRREGLALKVMLGAWLGKEPGNEASNARQVDGCIRLANAYADIVVAVNVGNEIFVEWTAHPVPEASALQYLERVKAAVSVPVTIADNYAWWASDDGVRMAQRVDFVTIHTYPLWERKDIDQAMAYTIENYERVKKVIPDKPIVIGEAGWATYTEGHHHVPRAGDEAKQTRYFEALSAWARDHGVTTFFFEAFDEPWKGTGTEGHWGLFTEGRKAKPVMQARFPDLQPDGPTSPTYTAQPAPTGGPPMSLAFGETASKQMGSGVSVPFGPGVLGASTAVGPDDRSALQLRLSGRDWGGLYFQLNSAFDASSFKRLVMRVHVDTAVASLELKLEGPLGTSHAVNAMDHAIAAEPGGWRTIAVPLAGWSEIDFSQLAIIGLWNPKSAAGEFVAGQVLISDIHFE